MSGNERSQGEARVEYVPIAYDMIAKNGDGYVQQLKNEKKNGANHDALSVTAKVLALSEALLLVQSERNSYIVPLEAFQTPARTDQVFPRQKMFSTHARLRVAGLALGLLGSDISPRQVAQQFPSLTGLSEELQRSGAVQDVGDKLKDFYDSEMHRCAGNLNHKKLVDRTIAGLVALLQQLSHVAAAGDQAVMRTADTLSAAMVDGTLHDVLLRGAAVDGEVIEGGARGWELYSHTDDVDVGSSSQRSSTTKGVSKVLPDRLTGVPLVIQEFLALEMPSLNQRARGFRFGDDVDERAAIDLTSLVHVLSVVGGTAMKTGQSDVTIAAACEGMFVLGMGPAGVYNVFSEIAPVEGNMVVHDVLPEEECRSHLVRYEQHCLRLHLQDGITRVAELLLHHFLVVIRYALLATMVAAPWTVHPRFAVFTKMRGLLFVGMGEPDDWLGLELLRRCGHVLPLLQVKVTNVSPDNVLIDSTTTFNDSITMPPMFKNLFTALGIRDGDELELEPPRRRQRIGD